jgi:hypothetical protein
MGIQQVGRRIQTFCDLRTDSDVSSKPNTWNRWQLAVPKHRSELSSRETNCARHRTRPNAARTPRREAARGRKLTPRQFSWMADQELGHTHHTHSNAHSPKDGMQNRTGRRQGSEATAQTSRPSNPSARGRSTQQDLETERGRAEHTEHPHAKRPRGFCRVFFSTVLLFFGLSALARSEPPCCGLPLFSVAGSAAVVAVAAAVECRL